VALNPSDKLRAVARDRQWASASFGSRGRPTLGQFIRSIAATVSLVPTFAAGLPIYALTGSRREATNFSIGLFAETASALINLNLVVRGEENLWKQRPAVFVFNHQSKADVVIGAKLLRRDMAGIGKQEIKKMPVIGKVLEMGGVVMIDRKNRPAPSRRCGPWWRRCARRAAP
jgi:putative phosphoserine phosphatase/1-acylglycerol-3-phosphate O-acyltransferase